MSFKDDEEPQAFLIWNRHHLASATLIGREPAPAAAVEGLTRFNFVYGNTEAAEYSPLLPYDIVPITETTELDELEEMERSDAMPKGPVYNIIQNKLNICEKRGPKFACRECRYVGHTRLSMVTHMKMHLRPFCEVCFNLFESKEAVHNHIESIHPEVVIRERTPPPPSRDFYCPQMVAPPNTPNPTSDDEMATVEQLLNTVKMPVNVAVVQKLLSTEDTDGGISTEDEQRLVIDDRSVPGPSRGRPKKKATIKRSLKKKANKTKLKDVSSTPDSVMKKITSRFGRSISLKMPQF